MTPNWKWFRALLPVVFWSLFILPAQALPDLWSFSNHSTNEIIVSRVLCDGKVFGIPVGILTPGGAGGSSADMFPRRVPEKFTIEYHKGTEVLTADISGKEVADLIKAASHSGKTVLHFIYSTEGKFIAKVEGQDRGSESYEHTLWPDEKEPNFQKYKNLVRAAYSGDAAGVRKALETGTPFSWPNDPVNLTPLEWAVRRDHAEASEELMKILPAEYSIYRYGHCINLAVSQEYISRLKKLLAHPLADKVASNQLQEIFYTACYSASTPTPVEILLQHYPVGINYRVRDYGHTLLFSAVQGRKPEIAEWLVKHGADINATLKDGSKPINHARDERMRLLLKPR